MSGKVDVPGVSPSGQNDTQTSCIQYPDYRQLLPYLIDLETRLCCLMAGDHSIIVVEVAAR